MAPQFKYSLVRYIAEKTDTSVANICVNQSFTPELRLSKMVQPWDFQPADFSKFNKDVKLMFA